MKKTLLLGILGLAATVATSYAQGYITLDNYGTYGPKVTYGPTGGGILGDGISSAFTVGLYWGQGVLVAGADTTTYGNDIPTSLNASLLLGTTAGSTIQASSSAFGIDGLFQSPQPFQASVASGATVTIMVVAYNGADYASSLIRGHSAAFQLVTKGATDLPPAITGNAMSAFAVNQTVPEPSTLALAGLGLASMLVARRRK